MATDYIQHDTLNVLKELPFPAELKKRPILGSRPYPAEDRYREELERKRFSTRIWDPLVDEQVLRLGMHAAGVASGHAQNLLPSGVTEKVLWFVEAPEIAEPLVETKAIQKLLTQGTPE